MNAPFTDKCSSGEMDLNLQSSEPLSEYFPHRSFAFGKHWSRDVCWLLEHRSAIIKPRFRAAAEQKFSRWFYIIRKKKSFEIDQSSSLAQVTNVTGNIVNLTALASLADRQLLLRKTKILPIGVGECHAG